MHDEQSPESWCDPPSNAAAAMRGAVCEEQGGSAALCDLCAIKLTRIIIGNCCGRSGRCFEGHWSKGILCSYKFSAILALSRMEFRPQSERLPIS